jgi:hypothetical protein
MTITETTPPTEIKLRLDFIKPFEGTNNVDFMFEDKGGSTVVIWAMTGEYNLITKIIGLFIDCTKMINDDFDKGLASLKAVAEAPAQK